MYMYICYIQNTNIFGMSGDAFTSSVIQSLWKRRAIFFANNKYIQLFWWLSAYYPFPKLLQWNPWISGLPCWLPQLQLAIIFCVVNTHIGNVAGCHASPQTYHTVVWGAMVSWCTTHSDSKRSMTRWKVLAHFAVSTHSIVPMLSSST